jgi:regulator of sirC expression with transglutaminase-like and TPR domain
MGVVTLWSEEDACRALALEAAVREGRLDDALFAVEAATDDAVTIARSEITHLAASVAARVASGSNAVHAMRAVLGEAGFRGDRDTYMAVANSHLTRVVARRRGMPILLSALWTLVGASAGVSVEGVGLPGHFIARVEGTLVDPFDGGTELDDAGCRRLLRAATGQDVRWTDAFLRATPVGELVARVISNLVRSHGGQGDAMSQLTCLGLLCAVRPGDPAPQLSRALLTEQIAGPGAAHDLLAELVRRFPAAREAAEARARLRPRTLN